MWVLHFVRYLHFTLPCKMQYSHADYFFILFLKSTNQPFFSSFFSFLYVFFFLFHYGSIFCAQMQVLHEPPKTTWISCFWCGYCNIEQKNQCILSNHMWTLEAKTPKTQCIYCDYHASIVIAITLHMWFIILMCVLH